MKDAKTKWFENVHHDEIKQQMRGEAPSTLTYVKPELDCPRRSSIAGVFCFEEKGTLSETVHALSALCLYTKASEREENLGPFCYGGDSLRPVDRLHSLLSDEILRTHIQSMHSFTMEFPGPVRCP